MKKKKDRKVWIIGPDKESVDKETRRYLKKWRRQDRKQRGDMTLMDWFRMTLGRKKK